MITNEGAFAHDHSYNNALEFFSKAGSLFVKKGSFYGNEATAVQLFKDSWSDDKEVSMKLLLWLRDCRGGAGNRSGARECMRWLAQNDPEWLMVNLKQIPQIGRWDDLRCLFGTDLQAAAAELWAIAIRDNDVLAAKWADRKDKPIRFFMGLSVGDFRRLLASIRSAHIVEHKMCQNEYNAIDYKTVPSVAMARYTNAFNKNDQERFEAFKEGIVKGEVKVHADVLFPHDCIRTSKHGDRDMADAQFDALPNFMEGTNEKPLVLSDTSGSMRTTVSGSVQAMDISQGMALYCSSRMPVDSPFYKRFIGFCSESNFKEWRGMTFSQAVHNEGRTVFDGAVGSTRIDKALDLILRIATERNIDQSMMPTTLLIVSDMQFHAGVEPATPASRETEGYWDTGASVSNAKQADTEVNMCLKKWNDAGYESPKIVYWNTAGNAGQQATAEYQNVGLVSGFSPSILKAVFGGDDFSPMGIMFQALEKYEIQVPSGL
jgi:hypothetical protein